MLTHINSREPLACVESESGSRVWLINAHLLNIDGVS